MKFGPADDRADDDRATSPPPVMTGIKIVPQASRPILWRQTTGAGEPDQSPPGRLPARRDGRMINPAAPGRGPPANVWIFRGFFDVTGKIV
jgi:hypothetical protein